jgi:hypothetical protein
MGLHINYEIEFGDDVNFDVDDVEEELKNDDIIQDVELMFLRDFNTPRCIACVYSHTKIEEVLSILLRMYNTPMKYRIYGEDAQWIDYTL